MFTVARKEVITVSTEFGQGKRVVAGRTPESAELEREHRLRKQAVERIYQLRRFKLHVVVFALGLPILGAIWVLTEYFEEHTWPDRFASAPDVAGTWDPWFFFVAGIWAIILAVHGLKTYFGPGVGPVGRYIRRPVTDAEINRAMSRMRPR
jgi:2TM domain-containing protein